MGLLLSLLISVCVCVFSFSFSFFGMFFVFGWRGTPMDFHGCFEFYVFVAVDASKMKKP